MSLSVLAPAVANLTAPDFTELLANPKNSKELEQRLLGQSVSAINCTESRIICLIYAWKILQKAPGPKTLQWLELA